MALKIRLGKIEFFTAYYILIQSIFYIHLLLPISISNYVVYTSSAGFFLLLYMILETGTI